MRKMREQKGYITIEATIVLSIYIFAFMMIFSLIHICRAQMKISVAINNAAKRNIGIFIFIRSVWVE